jgi:hypothetical protein
VSGNKPIELRQMAEELATTIIDRHTLYPETNPESLESELVHTALSTFLHDQMCADPSSPYDPVPTEQVLSGMVWGLEYIIRSGKYVVEQVDA